MNNLDPEDLVEVMGWKRYLGERQDADIALAFYQLKEMPPEEGLPPHSGSLPAADH